MIVTRIDIVGLTELKASLSKLPDATRDKVRVFVARFTMQLSDVERANLVERFKSGGDGPLYQGLKTETSETVSGASGRVYTTGAPYARIQEYGGTVQIPEIVPVKAQALAFMVGPAGFSSGGGTGGMIFAKRTKAHPVTIPERSYARTALASMRGAFADGIRAATVEAVTATGLLAAE